jgi:hypothetical protein
MSVYAQNQQLERQVAATLTSGILAASGVLKDVSSVDAIAEQGVLVFNAILMALQKSTKDRVHS